MQLLQLLMQVTLPVLLLHRLLMQATLRLQRLPQQLTQVTQPLLLQLQRLMLQLPMTHSMIVT
jgi:hypothetical protein